MYDLKTTGYYIINGAVDGLSAIDRRRALSLPENTSPWYYIPKINSEALIRALVQAEFFANGNADIIIPKGYSERTIGFPDFRNSKKFGCETYGVDDFVRDTKWNRELVNQAINDDEIGALEELVTVPENPHAISIAVSFFRRLRDDWVHGDKIAEDQIDKNRNAIAESSAIVKSKESLKKEALEKARAEVACELEFLRARIAELEEEEEEEEEA